jgi:PAS domain S-box-containing protein
MVQRYEGVTQRETQLQSHEFIVSKTDAKGRITYANRTFYEISGFKEEEVMGVQHNIVRHPDMPRSVFALLWQTIQQGQEIFAFVKNMRRDGGYYWVWANVTASTDSNQQLLGYHSVRRCPNRAALPAVSDLYAQMLAAERQAGARDAIQAGQAVLMKALQGQSYEQFVLSLQTH